MIALMMALALVQTAVPGQPAEPQWHSVHRSSRGEIFVDPASLRRSGDTFEVTVRGVFAQVQPSGMKSGITRNVYNCSERSFRTLHVRYLDANGAAIEDRPATGAIAAQRPVAPDSPNAAILREYCPR